MSVVKRGKYGSHLYAVGYLGVAVFMQVVTSWVTYFYAPPPERGLPAYAPIGLVGLAMVIGRIVDAVADPLVGVWSDNTRSRLGRRIPFLLYGTPLLAISFALIWRPPVAGESMVNLVFLLAVLGAFFFLFTVVVAPYLALLPEISRRNEERVRISAWQALFNIGGLGIAFVGASLLIEKIGFAGMGLTLALVGLTALWTPLLGVRETPRSEDDENGLPFSDAFLATVRNKVFLHYVVPQLLFWLGFNMVMIVIPYMVTVVMGLSEGQVGIVQGTALAVAVIFFPFIARLAAVKGNKTALSLTMACFVLVLSLLGTVGFWPGSAALQGWVIIALAGIPLAGLFIVPNALLSEVTDYDEQVTGRRREAMYFGVQGLMTKSAMALSSFLVTLILKVFGYSSTHPTGILLAGPLAAVFVLAGLLIFHTYPLGKPGKAEPSAK